MSAPCLYKQACLNNVFPKLLLCVRLHFIKKNKKKNTLLEPKFSWQRIFYPAVILCFRVFILWPVTAKTMTQRIQQAITDLNS